MTRVSFEWQESYSVGNELLDNQHKKILGLCQEINAQIDAAAKNYTSWIFALDSYAQSHFDAEEKIMREAGFPEADIASHEQGHHAFRAKLAKFHINLMTGNLDLVELRDFVERWWFDHILLDDMKYKPYMVNKTQS